MSSINPQIDAAVALMKARAAEFDETKNSDGMSFFTILELARRNFADSSVHYIDRNDEAVVEDLIDTMNLCALALSLFREPAA